MAYRTAPTVYLFPRLFTKIVLALLILSLLAACSSQETPEKTTAPQDNVKVQLSWLHSVAFIPFYMAKDQGNYQQHQLNTEILEGGFDADGNFIVPIEMVTSGKADFGVVDASNLLLAREQGAPVVAIAAVLQKNPLALVSLAENNITQPSDLADHTVDVTYNSLLNYNALLSVEGIDPAAVTTQDRQDLSTASLLNGDVDVIDAWMITEVAELLAADQAINLIVPGEYGVEVYAQVLFTTEAMIQDNPELVERFLAATLEGMQAASDNPAEAVAITLKYTNTRTAEIETVAMNQLLPLMLPAQTQPGEMTADIWQYTQQLLVDQAILSQPLPDLNAAYTTRFLDAVHSN